VTGVPAPGGGQRGSVLMLVPAAVLVLVILGAVAVDFAIVFLAQRDLANRAAAAANDIAGFAVSDQRFYDEGAVALGQEEATRYVRASLEPARRTGRLESVAGGAEVDGRDVAVWAEGEVRYLFAPAIPGVRHTATVRATSRATAVGG
jgi:uncharacterized membrane protein